jgi:hypothetical protein
MISGFAEMTKAAIFASWLLDRQQSNNTADHPYTSLLFSDPNVYYITSTITATELLLSFSGECGIYF